MRKVVTVIFAIGLSFFITSALSKFVFFGTTPRIRLDLIQYVASLFKREYEPQNTTSVSALDHDDLYKEEFNSTSNLKEYTFTLSDGRVIIIKIPANVDPPPLSVVEELAGKK